MADVKIPDELAKALTADGVVHNGYAEDVQWAMDEVLGDSWPERERSALADLIITKVLSVKDGDIVIMQLPECFDPTTELRIAKLLHVVISKTGRTEVIPLLFKTGIDMHAFNKDEVGDFLMMRCRKLDEENRRLKEELQLLKNPTPVAPGPPPKRQA